MIDGIPVVLVAFKLIVLGTGMFFAIKWHYDKENEVEKRAVLHAAGKMAALFVLALLGVGLFAFALTRMLGLDMTLP